MKLLVIIFRHCYIYVKCWARSNLFFEFNVAIPRGFCCISSTSWETLSDIYNDLFFKNYLPQIWFWFNRRKWKIWPNLRITEEKYYFSRKYQQISTLLLPYLSKASQFLFTTLIFVYKILQILLRFSRVMRTCLRVPVSLDTSLIVITTLSTSRKYSK